MNYLMLLMLTLFLLLLFTINMKLTNNDLISPNTIIYIMMLFSIIIAAFFYKKVGFILSPEATLILIFSVLIFSIPCFMIPHQVRNSIVLKKTEISFYGSKIIIFSLFFVLLTTILLYREVTKVSELIGYGRDSELPMLYYYRNATLNGSEAISSRSNIVGQMTIVSFAISYLIIVDFSKKLVFGIKYFSKKIVFLELITIFAYLFQCILSGGRTQFLYYIEALIFSTLFYLQKVRGRSIETKYLKKIMLSIILVFISFYFLGGLTGKTARLDFGSTLFVYLGSPIPAFSQLVQNNISFVNEYWGSNVFIGIFELLGKFGYKINVGQEVAPNVNVGNLVTNIYGSFGRIYASFGLIGLFFYNLFLGMFYQMIYVNLQRRKVKLELYLVIYLIILKFLFDYCIEERFFLSVISLGTVLRIFYAVLFYYLFNKLVVNISKKDEVKKY